jgi:CheY-like chemotaxis protein
MSQLPSSILLVEDDPIVLESTAELLQGSGFAVLCACSAGEALALLEQGPVPPVVVTDISLAGTRTGLELARTIAERWPGTRLLIVSGACRPAPSEFPDGALFFTKPYAEGALVAMVKGEVW